MVHTNRKVIEPKEVNDLFHELLEIVWLKDVTLFPQAFQDNMELISERYSTFRSLRRGSDTRALEKKVAKTDTETVNRWSREKSKGGRHKQRDMTQHYADLDMLHGPFLRYTQAM